MTKIKLIKKKERELREFENDNLSGGVFHCTTLNNLEKILKNNALLFIKNNKDSTWEGSFSNKNGYISLFDFRNSGNEEVLESLGKFNCLGLKEFSRFVVYFILDRKFYKEIILQDREKNKQFKNKKISVKILIKSKCDFKDQLVKIYKEEIEKLKNNDLPEEIIEKENLITPEFWEKKIGELEKCK